jgi:outer membrane protein
MKKGLLTLMIAALTVISTQAQTKFGYLNSNELIGSMAETKSDATELDEYTKKLESQLSDMQSELERKAAEYQQNETTYSDLVKEDKMRELESIQKRMVDFQQSAQQALAQKETELFTPIREKALAAIEQVAKEGNYTYIFEGTGALIYVDEKENIIDKVKAKLGM